MKAFPALFISFLLLVSYIKAQNVTYDFYVFASFWVGTICTLSSCLANQTALASPSFFSIHGLWPDYNDGSYPSYCDNSSIFNPAELNAGLKSIMNTHWIGLSTPTDLFHDHEWSKHGTCWNGPESYKTTAEKMNAYFSTVVNIAFQYNLFQSLKLFGNVTPSATPYDLSRFNAAFDRLLGPGTYILQCQQPQNSTDQYLAYTNICLDLDYKPMPCPAALLNNFPGICPPGDIYYPQLNQTTAEEVSKAEKTKKIEI